MRETFYFIQHTHSVEVTIFSLNGEEPLNEPPSVAKGGGRQGEWVFHLCAAYFVSLTSSALIHVDTSGPT